MTDKEIAEIAKVLTEAIVYDHYTALYHGYTSIYYYKSAKNLIEAGYGNIKEYQSEIDRLQMELAKIEKGMLVKLPCKVGDSIFYVWNGKIETYIVDRIGCDNNGWYFNVDDEDHFDHYFDDSSEIGVTVFFDRTEAEAKLAEMEGN